MSGWRLEYSIDADVENRVMYVKIFGVWRVNIAEAYHQDFMEEAEPLIKKPWVRLIDLINWKMASPDGIEALGKHMQWCNENNAQCAVFIINNQVTYNQLQKMFEKGKAKDTTKTFRTHAEGIKFLSDLGYTMRE